MWWNESVIAKNNYYYKEFVRYVWNESVIAKNNYNINYYL